MGSELQGPPRPTLLKGYPPGEGGHLRSKSYQAESRLSVPIRPAPPTVVGKVEDKGPREFHAGRFSPKKTDPRRTLSIQAFAPGLAERCR
jgi:hypothetical protein